MVHDPSLPYVRRLHNPNPAWGRIACDLVTLVPPGGHAAGPSGAVSDPWAGVRDELAADVRRVSDRLRSLSATRLASPPAPSPGQGADFASRAQAGRAAAGALARAAAALEAAAGGPEAAEPAPDGPEAAEPAPEGTEAAEAAPEGPDVGRSAEHRQPPDLPVLPVLPDLAVGDQVAVTGHDLLAALDLVRPGTAVRTGPGRPVPAELAVAVAWELLRDVRRRL